MEKFISVTIKISQISDDLSVSEIHDLIVNAFDDILNVVQIDDIKVQVKNK